MERVDFCEEVKGGREERGRRGVLRWGVLDSLVGTWNESSLASVVVIKDLLTRPTNCSTEYPTRITRITIVSTSITTNTSLKLTTATILTITVLTNAVQQQSIITPIKPVVPTTYAVTVVAIANIISCNVNDENLEELLDNKDNWTTPYGPCTLLK